MSLTLVRHLDSPLIQAPGKPRQILPNANSDPTDTPYLALALTVSLTRQGWGGNEGDFGASLGFRVAAVMQFLTYYLDASVPPPPCTATDSTALHMLACGYGPIQACQLPLAPRRINDVDRSALVGNHHVPAGCSLSLSLPNPNPYPGPNSHPKP